MELIKVVFCILDHHETRLLIYVFRDNHICRLPTAEHNFISRGQNTKMPYVYLTNKQKKQNKKVNAMTE